MTAIQQAMQHNSVFNAALAYTAVGLSVIPVNGKRPAVQWARYQAIRTPYSHIHEWNRTRKLTGVGIVCGQVWGNLVVVDLDGTQAVQTFHAMFPDLCNTLTVATGSGQGEHLYFHTAQPTVTTRTKTETGGYELRSDGCYVVAPPSIHPSGNPYTVGNNVPVMQLDNLNPVRDWIMTMIRTKQRVIPRQEQTSMFGGHNPRWVNAAVTRELSKPASEVEGNSNNTLNTVSYRLARICANPDSGLVESHIKADILSAAQHLTNRDGLSATLATIESGWKAGIQKPAHIPEPNGYGRKQL